MQFKDISGHSTIIGNIRSMVDNNRMPHAILFAEKHGYGALHIVLATISYMFCQNRTDGDSCGCCSQCSKTGKLVHPDLHFTFPINTSTVVGKEKRAEIEEFYPIWRNLVKENPWFSEQQLYRALGIENKFGNISVNEANGIMRKLSLSSYEGGIKVMLIMFPERMNQEAANKLLKSIEEPQNDTYYFMISHNPAKIISTILSRCRIIGLHPIDEALLAQSLKADFGMTDEDAAFWARCSGGSYGKAAELIQNDRNSSESYATFLELLNLGVKKDLVAMFDIWNNIAGWGKEAQKEFCTEALEILRKIYITGLGMEEISYAGKQEQENLKRLSESLKPDFYEKGYHFLNNAIDCIERNVNPKFIFCDLCNRIYYNS